MLRLNLTFLFGACLALFAVGASLSAQDAKLAAAGKVLVTDHRCGLCHTMEGKGGKLAKSLDGVSARRDTAALKRVLTDPAKELPDAKLKMPKVEWRAGELDAVVAYLQSLKPLPAK